MNENSQIKFLILFCTILFSANCSWAYDEINLVPVESNKIEIPKSYVDNLEKINLEKSQLKQKEKSVYFESEEDVFENKAGKAFSKFINDKAINNKINRMYSDIESKYLDEDY